MEPKANKYKINVTNYSKQGDHIEYFIKMTSSEDSNFSIEFLERYSNLKTLHDKLKSENASSSSFPIFPPKKFFGSTDAKFLTQRQGDLNNYSIEINKATALYNLPSYQKWIVSILQKHLSSPPKEKSDKIKQKETQEKQVMTPETLKKIVDQYSEQFFDFTSNQLDEKEEDDIEKDYKQIIRDNSVFKQKVIKESQLFTITQGKDDNFAFLEKENELLIETEIKLKAKLSKIDDLTQNELPTMYFIDYLIIPFKV